MMLFNTLKRIQNTRIFADGILNTCFESFTTKVSMKFILKALMGNTLLLVQLMAWYRTENKPLPELLMT